MQEITRCRLHPMKERIAGLNADWEVAKSLLQKEKDDFSITVSGKVYTDRKEAGTALIAACSGLKTVQVSGTVGEFHGFSLSAAYDSFNQCYNLTIKGKCSYTVEVGKDALGNIMRIQNTLTGIEKKLPEAKLKLETLQEQLLSAQEWSYVKKKYKLNVTNFLCSERSLTCYFYCILLDVFKILFLIFIWRQISTMTVNAYGIIKCFDVFKNQFMCMCIIKDFKPVDPFSLQKCMERFYTGVIPWICFL